MSGIAEGSHGHVGVHLTRARSLLSPVCRAAIVAHYVAAPLAQQQQWWAGVTAVPVDRLRLLYEARLFLQEAKDARQTELGRGLANIMRIEYINIPADELPSAENTMIRYANTHGNANTCNRDNNQGTDYTTTLAQVNQHAVSLATITTAIANGQLATLSPQQLQRRYYEFWNGPWVTLTNPGDTREYAPVFGYFTEPNVCVSPNRLNAFKADSVLAQQRAVTINAHQATINAQAANIATLNQQVANLQQQLQAQQQQQQPPQQAQAPVQNGQAPMQWAPHFKQVPVRDKFMRLKDRLMKEMDNTTEDVNTAQAQTEESTSDEPTAEENA